MRRNALRFIGAYVTCASLAFGVIYAHTAYAGSIATVYGGACRVTDSSGDILCPLPGGSYIGSGILRVYFDYMTYAAGQSTLYIGRVSYSGTVTLDSKTVSGTPRVAQDVEVLGNRVNTNLYIWDYYYAYIHSTEGITVNSVYGIGVGTK